MRWILSAQELPNIYMQEVLTYSQIVYWRALARLGRCRGTSRHALSAVLRIALLTQRGEQHEADKEPGNALAGHLAHRDRHTASGQHSNSSHRDYSCGARYRSWCFDPAWSVDCSVSPPAVLSSDWNRHIALCARRAYTRPRQRRARGFLARLVG